MELAEKLDYRVAGPHKNVFIVQDRDKWGDEVYLSFSFDPFKLRVETGEHPYIGPFHEWDQSWHRHEFDEVFLRDGLARERLVRAIEILRSESGN